LKESWFIPLQPFGGVKAVVRTVLPAIYPKIMTTKKPLALREWRYPRTYRTIFARKPRDIFQADVMVLKPLWNHIFPEFYIHTKYRPKDFALVCIDVFSRYVWAVAMDDEDAKTTADAIIKIFQHMGTPQIFQGDKKITDAFKKHIKFDYPNVSSFTTKPNETNKNAIVERVIRTLKNDLLKYLYYHEFPEIREKLVGEEYVYEDTTSEVLQEICRRRNNTFHRTIREKPIDVFLGRAPNRQIVVRKKYPQFDIKDIVLIKPIRFRGDIPKKIFGLNYDIYIIVAKDGDKYQVRSLYNLIHKKKLPKGKEYEEQRQIEKYWFKPYEIRKLSPQEALAHLNSPLTQAYVYRIHEDPEAVNDMRKYIHQL
jgi:transposase InsO family protein